MIIGDVVESAIWLTGDEPKDLRLRYEADVRGAIDVLCQQKGFAHNPVTFVEKKPDEDKVPEVPDHIQGSRVRLLVAEATITDTVTVETSKGSFIAELELSDLKKLRQITRKAYAKNYGTLIGNPKCDEIIEALGPDSALESLRTLH